MFDDFLLTAAVACALPVLIYRSLEFALVRLYRFLKRREHQRHERSQQRSLQEDPFSQRYLRQYELLAGCRLSVIELSNRFDKLIGMEDPDIADAIGSKLFYLWASAQEKRILSGHIVVVLSRMLVETDLLRDQMECLSLNIAPRSEQALLDEMELMARRIGNLMNPGDTIHGMFTELDNRLRRLQDAIDRFRIDVIEPWERNVHGSYLRARGE